MPSSPSLLLAIWGARFEPNTSTDRCFAPVAGSRPGSGQYCTCRPFRHELSSLGCDFGAYPTPVSRQCPLERQRRGQKQPCGGFCRASGARNLAGTRGRGRAQDGQCGRCHHRLLGAELGDGQCPLQFQGGQSPHPGAAAGVHGGGRQFPHAECAAEAGNGRKLYPALPCRACRAQRRRGAQGYHGAGQVGAGLGDAFPSGNGVDLLALEPGPEGFAPKARPVNPAGD